MGSEVDGRGRAVGRIQPGLEKRAGVGKSMSSVAGDGSWCCRSFADVPDLFRLTCPSASKSAVLPTTCFCRTDRLSGKGIRQLHWCAQDSDFPKKNNHRLALPENI